ncbi:hypothetical protein NKH61_19000 [Mesorhizobium sp. M1005]|uniref:hypothetical protein n=2 Tax=unclassified Mesorhizobium TaxID=325217 RepID=UPI0033396E50
MMHVSRDLNHHVRALSAVPTTACDFAMPVQRSIEAGDRRSRDFASDGIARFSVDVSIWWAAPNGLFNGLIWPKVGCASIA